MFVEYDISSEFTFVGVSGVDHNNFLVGHPYGGVSIIIENL